MLVPKQALVLTLLFASSLVTSGCISAVGQSGDEGLAGAAIPADWARKALPFGGSHNHLNPNHHKALSTSNFEVLGWDAAGTDFYGGKTAGGYACGEVGERADGTKLAVVNSITSEVAFVLVDVTDAAHPTKVGEFVLKNALIYDSAISPDGKHVFLGAYPEGVFGTNRPPADNLLATAGIAGSSIALVSWSYRDCNGVVTAEGTEELPLAPGIVVVNVEDVAAPWIEEFQPTPVIGPHSVSTKRIDGATYVVASITNLVHHASYYSIYELVDTPAGGHLVPLAVIDAGRQGTSPLINGHLEAEIAKHPATGQILAYLSNWDGGLLVYDISIPQAPLFVAKWKDQGADGGGLHGTYSMPDLRDGRHYILAGQEFIAHPVNRPSGWIYILDDTDPANIFEVSRWTLPLDIDQNWRTTELFSTHYFTVVGNTMFVTMYHGGIWAVSLANLAEPQSVGAFIPDRAPPMPPTAGGLIAGWPFVLDVIALDDGSLVVFDASTGVYVVRYDASNPAPAPTPWPQIRI